MRRLNVRGRPYGKDMHTVIALFVAAHILCWAVTLGLWVADAKTRQPNAGMAHSAACALVFGLCAMAFSMGAISTGHLWYTIKLLLSVLATVFAFVAISRREETSDVVWYGIPLCIVGNVLVAVFNVGA